MRYFTRGLYDASQHDPAAREEWDRRSRQFHSEAVAMLPYMAETTRAAADFCFHDCVIAQVSEPDEDRVQLALLGSDHMKPIDRLELTLDGVGLSSACTDKDYGLWLFEEWRLLEGGGIELSVLTQQDEFQIQAAEASLRISADSGLTWTNCLERESPI